MDTYYIVKNETESGWLNSISRNSIYFGGDYYDAIKLTTIAMGEAFVDYCETVDTVSEMKLYKVELNIEPVPVTP